jgi:hypothetical protein
MFKLIIETHLKYWADGAFIVPVDKAPSDWRKQAQPGYVAKGSPTKDAFGLITSPHSLFTALGAVDLVAFAFQHLGEELAAPRVIIRHQNTLA